MEEIRTSTEERIWRLFTHICDKQDLDLKGENIKAYQMNFESAFAKAKNIVDWYNKRTE